MWYPGKKVADSDKVRLGFSQGKTVFYPLYNKNCWSRRLTASDIFHQFTQSIKFHTFHYHILKSVDVWDRRFIKYT